MDYSRLVRTYQQLEQTQSTLEKTSILADLYLDAGQNVEEVVLLSMGRAFPEWKDLELGISSKTMVEIIKEASGHEKERIEREWKESGDLGSAASELLEHERQQNLVERELTAERVREKLERVASMGERSLDGVSMDKKKREVAALLNDAEPEEAKYITRTFLENMRLGVGEGTVRDALDEAFLDGEHSVEVQEAYNVTNDFEEVAAACFKGIEEVRSLEMELFRPVKSMLAKKVESVEEGFEEVGRPAAAEVKYDGVRAQVHCRDGEVRIFTRRLEDVTEQFPDAVEAVEEHVKADSFILDCELVGYDPETGGTIPFQRLSKRVKRKYEIERMMKEIPVEVRPFDLIYHKGSVIELPESERFEKLQEMLEEETRELRGVERVVRDELDEVEEFRREVQEEGHEGIMMKSLKAEYKPGKRVGYMVKIKPVMETLDLAIIGAKWSEGRRSGWLGRLKLGCWNEEEGRHEMVGRMATGLTDEELEEITEKLEPLIVDEEGRDVELRPEVILEVEFEEIQSSPKYESGYALRFPRMKAFRDDKERADLLERVGELYESQTDT